MRAQTTLDFAIGMSLFLVVVAFVVTFVPTMLQPFDAKSGENVVGADRVGNQLSRRYLAADEPFVLDVSCTTALFDGTSPPGCRFDGSTLQDRLGLADDAKVNVRLVGDDDDGNGDPDVLCSDGGTVDEPADFGGSCPGTLLEAGQSPPTDTESVVVARRVVAIDGRDATLLVRMW